MQAPIPLCEQRVFGPVTTWRCPHVPGAHGEPQARVLLGRALDVAPAAVPLRRDARGRPYLVDAAGGWDTGWSHSGDQLLVALGQGVRLGVDLERIRARPRMMEVVRRYFHPVEIAALEALPEDQRSGLFFRLWCAKEALLKAHGHGISFGLHRLAFVAGEHGLVLAECDPVLGRAADWRLVEWQATPVFRAALAWRPR